MQRHLLHLGTCLLLLISVRAAGYGCNRDGCRRARGRELFEGNDIPTYVGHWFETICLEWTIVQANKGALPIRPVRFGSWWGADPARKGQTGIDVMAGSKRRRELFVGECRGGEFVRCGKNDAGACAEGTAHIGLRHGSLRPVHEGTDFSGLCWDAWSRVDLCGCREALRRMRWHAADSNGLRREMGEWPVLRTEGRRQKEKRSGNRSASHLVARSRFELLISALRGRRPKPLDERAICKASKWPRKIW